MTSSPTEYAPPAAAATPPGWYADPWSQAEVRWWDGSNWTGHALSPPEPPALPAPPAPLEKLSMASLVAGVVGVSPVAIVTGLIARRRIKHSNGALEGGGIAVIGILLGVVYLAATVALIAVALSQPADERPTTANAERYTGYQRDIAVVVDDFGSAYARGESEKLCDEVFSPALAADYEKQFGSCSATWSGGYDLKLHIDAIKGGVNGSTAYVRATDRDGLNWWFEVYDGRFENVTQP